MNSFSQETLRKAETNNSNLTTLILREENNIHNGSFHSNLGDDYSLLGEYIGNNTHLQTLMVEHNNTLALSVREQDFFEGLIRNSSINELSLHYNDNEVWRSILEVYKQNNNLTRLHIDSITCNDHLISDTVSCCTNLREISLWMCYMTNEQLLQMVEAIRGHAYLEILKLYGNNIGNAGCDIIATLLADPSCNLHTLRLINERISNEGMIVLVNSLVNNIKLRKINLDRNLVNNINEVEDTTISRLLCNTSNINSIYASNHTFDTLVPLGRLHPSERLQFLFTLNRSTNKDWCTNKDVAIKKILKYHPNINMEPYFDWNSDGEWTLKALPYVVDWFDRAREIVCLDDYDYQADEKKFSAIYQFARSMPLMIVPLSHTKVGDKKRKR